MQLLLPLDIPKLWCLQFERRRQLWSQKLQPQSSCPQRQQVRQDAFRKLTSFSGQHGEQRDVDRVVLYSYFDPI
jgi:hypothetical protein